MAKREENPDTMILLGLAAAAGLGLALIFSKKAGTAVGEGVVTGARDAAVDMIGAVLSVSDLQRVVNTVFSRTLAALQAQGTALSQAQRAPLTLLAVEGKRGPKTNAGVKLVEYLTQTPEAGFGAISVSDATLANNYMTYLRGNNIA
jgi:hypothetical protein